MLPPGRSLWTTYDSLSLIVLVSLWPAHKIRCISGIRKKLLECSNWILVVEDDWVGVPSFCKVELVPTLNNPQDSAINTHRNFQTRTFAHVQLQVGVLERVCLRRSFAFWSPIKTKTEQQ
jgi:hypothetical protein